MENYTKILIVEDEIITAEDLKKELEKLNYEVTSIVRKGEDALKKIRIDYPDVVLMDIKLEGQMDGVETAKKIKNEYELPIIYVTAYSDAEVIERAKEIGSAGFITKPFSRKELYSNIEIALSRSKQKRKIKHLNRVLHAVRDISKLITIEQSRKKLLQKVCNILVNTRGYENTWIVLLEDSNLKNFVHQGLSDPEAVKEVFANQNEVDCIMEALNDKEAILKEKLKSECGDNFVEKNDFETNIMISPIQYKDKKYGLIGIHYSEKLIIYNEEISLFREMADDIAFALYKIEIDKERKKTEEKLRDSEERYRTLTEFSPDPIIIHNGKEIQYINQAGMDLMDVKYKDNIIGKAAIDFVHPDSRDIAKRNMKAMLERGEVINNVEEKLVSKKGAVKHVEISGQQITYKHKPSIQLVVRDITKRKQAEQEKKELEKRYRQSQKMEAVGQLAGGIAHNLNNMLTPILGYSQLLQRRIEDENYNTPLEAIVESSKKARDLVSQLLTFSRKTKMEREVVDLNEVIRRFKTLLDKSTRENIRIDVSLNTDIPKIEADKKQIEQVIMNLVINAQDAIEKRGEISINTYESELDQESIQNKEKMEPGIYTVLEVGDTGQGMDQETQKRIFEPFFTTKEEGEGSGLGLATVYGIIKQHNGMVHVSSEPGEGTVFKIYFPPAEKEENKKQEKIELPEIKSGDGNILLAEDDSQVRNLAQGILENLGYRVYSYQDGSQIITDIQDGKIEDLDLLLTDIIMPNVNGKELYKQVKEEFPELKVIYITGYPRETVLKKGELEEQDAFIQKPFPYDELVDQVYKVLN